MIYGANGYTGELTARLAVARGERPVLAGRSADKVRPLAEQLGLEHRAFDLRDSAALRQGLEGIAAVLRHRSVQTTSIYAKVDVELLRSVAQPWPVDEPC